jgi:hypothetical protein
MRGEEYTVTRRVHLFNYGSHRFSGRDRPRPPRSVFVYARSEKPFLSRNPVDVTDLLRMLFLVRLGAHVVDPSLTLALGQIDELLGQQLFFPYFCLVRRSRQVHVDQVRSRPHFLPLGLGGRGHFAAGFLFRQLFGIKSGNKRKKCSRRNGRDRPGPDPGTGGTSIPLLPGLQRGADPVPRPVIEGKPEVAGRRVEFVHLLGDVFRTTDRLPPRVGVWTNEPAA